jgi:ATP-dependent Clp protease ATP-binding subunit ClpA
VIENVLGGDERVIIQQIVPTSRVKKVIELAFEEGRRQGVQYVDGGHLLVALSLEGEGIAAHVLEDLGATLTRVRAAVRKARTELGVTAPSSGPALADSDADADVLRRLVQVPHLARLLESKGLAVDALVELLSHPPDHVVKLRGYVAELRRELRAKVDARDFEAAARLQKGEKDLLARLARAEKEWIDGL